MLVHYLQRRNVMLVFICLILLWSTAFVDKAAAAEVVSSDFIIVNKKTNKLAYFRNGKLDKVFSVATGKDPSLTPEGSFKIVNKIKNRPYYKEKIAGGDPRNPLGDRWLGLEVNGTKGTTYAIHGNNNVNSIGKYVSAGCIRMKNEEIHWLFSQVKLNIVAIITSSNLPFEQIAINNGKLPDTKVLTGKLIIDGKKHTLKEPLVLEDSRVYIPLRESIRLLGANLQWNNKTETITMLVNGHTITHKPLSNQATVDGVRVEIIESRYQGETVMISLKSLLQLSGLQGKWDSKSNAAIIYNS
ncbi:MAG TPA: L,D-transpeptidase family protein [Paenibacillus sp.]